MRERAIRIDQLHRRALAAVLGAAALMLVLAVPRRATRATTAHPRIQVGVQPHYGASRTAGFCFQPTCVQLLPPSSERQIELSNPIA